MRYQGSKRRAAKHILPIIEAYRKPGQVYVEPFLGGGNLFWLVEGPKVGNDAHPYVVALLRAVRDGWVPPTKVTPTMYRSVKANPKLFSPELAGFVGFGCSFGGKWMVGYAKDRNHVNYAAQARNTLLNQRRGLLGSKLLSGDYRKLVLPPNSLIYCDPPLRVHGRLQRHGQVGPQSLLELGVCPCSGKDTQSSFRSIEAPAFAECLWEGEQVVPLAHKANYLTRTERLFRVQTDVTCLKTLIS